jgi:hypothetical protein
MVRARIHRMPIFAADRAISARRTRVVFREFEDSFEPESARARSAKGTALADKEGETET